MSISPWASVALPYLGCFCPLPTIFMQTVTTWDLTTPEETNFPEKWSSSLETTEERKRPGPKPDFADYGELKNAVITAIRAEWRRTGKKPSQNLIASYFTTHPQYPAATSNSLGKRLIRAKLDWEELLKEGNPFR